MHSNELEENWCTDRRADWFLQRPDLSSRTQSREKTVHSQDGQAAFPVYSPLALGILICATGWKIWSVSRATRSWFPDLSGILAGHLAEGYMGGCRGVCVCGGVS